MKPKDFYRSLAWRYCSRYVLLFYSIDGLYVKCSTCGKIMQVNSREAHCGHLIKITDSWATAFEFENLAPQCMRDNRFLGGRQDLMKEWLIKKHGIYKINDLYIRKHNFCKPEQFHLDYWAGYYKRLFEKLAEEKGNPWKKNVGIRSY